MQRPKAMVLINRDFQLKYAGAAVGVGVLSTALSVIVILYPLYVFEILRIPQFLPLPILFSMVFAALLNILMIGLVGVYVTHSIAGPMYAVVREFRKVENGDWSGAMRQRKNDDLRYLVRNYNAMMDSLRNQAEVELEDINNLKHTIDKLDNAEVKAVSNELDRISHRWNMRLGLSKEK